MAGEIQRGKASPIGEIILTETRFEADYMGLGIPTHVGPSKTCPQNRIQGLGAQNRRKHRVYSDIPEIIVRVVVTRCQVPFKKSEGKVLQILEERSA